MFKAYFHQLLVFEICTLLPHRTGRSRVSLSDSGALAACAFTAYSRGESSAARSDAKGVRERARDQEEACVQISRGRISSPGSSSYDAV